MLWFSNVLYCLGLTKWNRYVVVKIHASWEDFKGHFRQQVCYFAWHLMFSVINCALSVTLISYRMVKNGCWHLLREDRRFIRWVLTSNPWFSLLAWHRYEILDLHFCHTCCKEIYCLLHVYNYLTVRNYRLEGLSGRTRILLCVKVILKIWAPAPGLTTNQKPLWWDNPKVFI